MKAEDTRDESVDPKPKAPYQRPKPERVVTLRDVTAQATGLPVSG
jgi:hypothetical protein